MKNNVYAVPCCELLQLETEALCTSIQDGSTSGYGYNDDYDEME